MLMMEDLTDEQIQGCLTEGIELERFKRIALTTQKLVQNFDGNGNSGYAISDGHTAALYCKEILSTFTSAEHTEAWETEFNTWYDKLHQAADKINEILRA
jgi:hypothetical protein